MKDYEFIDLVTAYITSENEIVLIQSENRQKLLEQYGSFSYIPDDIAIECKLLLPEGSLEPGGDKIYKIMNAKTIGKLNELHEIEVRVSNFSRNYL